MLAVLLAAILLSYAFVAPAAGTITGIVSTILGSLFINFQAPPVKDDPAPAPAPGPSQLAPTVVPAPPKGNDQ